MDWGMKNRMARLINPETGHAVFLALDHGYFQGPIKKLEEPQKTLKPLLPYADAIMVTRGILRTSVDAAKVGPVILRVSGGMTLAGPSLSKEGIITSVKEAVRLNVSAIATSIHVGTEDEHDTLTNLSRLVDEAEEFGLPVLAVTSVGRELEKREARYLALCCRVAAELGARIVKTYYCEDFEKVVTGCPVPLVIAGGPRMESERDVLEVTYNAVSRGAVGVDMGRNIFQAESPVGMIKAIRAIVHEGASVKAAAEVLAGESKRAVARV
ncbi:MAG: 3-hydroxy-5-phosphonooxypentane-2,4-dione thiolase [Chloroflexi bacterium]|nr:3-hydroxy-5-phosphonooxypentane-2,4-dione thiolase [Chloroflexota bacterium]